MSEPTPVRSDRTHTNTTYAVTIGFAASLTLDGGQTPPDRDDLRRMIAADFLFRHGKYVGDDDPAIASLIDDIETVELIETHTESI